MYLLPDCQHAVDKIINEAIVKEEGKPICEIDLDQLDVSKKIKDAIKREWNVVAEMMRFNQEGYNIFLRWYVDGRIYYQKVIDKNDPRAGIKELRYVDPRKLRKIRTTKAKRHGKIVVTEPDQEFYVYNEKGFAKDAGPVGVPSQTTGLKITTDLIATVNSGLMDPEHKMVLGWMHKAIRPLNMLRMLEDSTVIYRISRAAERRMFYVDVGQLPPSKAEQYMTDMITKYKNRVVYDPQTGVVLDDRKYATMYEDMWFPTRGNMKGVQVDTLPGAQNMDSMSDNSYFKGKLLESLNVPLSRLQESAPFNMGRSSEISRDELEFQKFIDRLRNRFVQLFIDILGTQLVLKGVITEEDWDVFQDKILFTFARDNYYAELKDLEILSQRMEVVGQLDAYDGKYFSRLWVMRNVLKFTDDDIAEMEYEMKQEKKSDGAEETTFQNFDSETPPGQTDENGMPIDEPEQTDAEGNPFVVQSSAIPK